MSTENSILSAVSMTSKDISSLVESRHDKVKQSIKRLAKKGVISQPPMGEVEDNQSLSPNSKTSVYIFTGDKGRRDSIVVVAQLSPEFTARIVDRWQELEDRLRATPEEVLRLYWQEYRNSAASNYNMLMRSVDDAVLWLHPELRRKPFELTEKQRVARMKEADTLNEIIIGMPAWKYRRYFKQHQVPAIRDYFPAKILEVYDQAEVLDATLIEQREPRSKRVEAIQQMIRIRFPEVLMFRNVIGEQVRRIDFAEASEDDEGALIHPIQYHELRADKGLLDLLGVQETLSLQDTYAEIESERTMADIFGE